MTREETVKNLLTELIDMIDNGSQRDLDRADEIGASIINLFKQEPCDDLISREAVLNTEYQVKIINDIEYVMLSEVQMKIRKMPSVTQKSGKWIPVSERLPDIGQRVLVTYNQEDKLKVDTTIFDRHGFLIGVVTAWMPLPKPYEPQESEDKE